MKEYESKRVQNEEKTYSMDPNGPKGFLKTQSLIQNVARALGIWNMFGPMVDSSPHFLVAPYASSHTWHGSPLPRTPNSKIHSNLLVGIIL